MTKPAHRRVLGIDCGSAIAGWSVIDDEGNKLVHVASGAVTTSSKDDTSLRLKIMYHGMLELIDTYQPDAMAIEKLFYFKNQKTIIAVSQARGVTVLAGAERNLPVFGYTPLQVKIAVTGYGRAEKQQVQQMVTKIMRLKEVPKPDDVADAIAVGICHLNSVR